MNEALVLIDDIEQALERMRGMIDPALKASLVTKLDRLRALSTARVMIKPSGRYFSPEEAAEIARRVMETHRDTLTALGQR